METKTPDVTERILTAATELFSQKGFDATSVNEIAALAGVNKALIYYYFPSKDALLGSIVRKLTDHVDAMTMDFCSRYIVNAIKEGTLDILTDRLRFTDTQTRGIFMDALASYCRNLTEYAISQKDVVRIMLSESLKTDSKYQVSLFSFLIMGKEEFGNHLYTLLHDADPDYTPHGEMTLLLFFFIIIPIMNFAAHLEDYHRISGVATSMVVDTFLASIAHITTASISGNDVLLCLPGNTPQGGFTRDCTP
ncbi:TetR/AcrR family transcriptional regulator [Parasphaerochaeta coccoides]|uniref:Transcriptional regulator, TetR family n=1 Tax=Parasphaerochaeta coccoides (strain ATCC BAA-1237 / DSM 17374 / SPN1) TaxID=760011 RepID=F4GKF1_PARC1|nr:TetR/AcrR family transcriptional regulator [Parasphaerochaeta coccoides]AEC02834.1 transcriptional regulator, TetR family [Parasphaerochaeta coccoides DSM 17374]